MLRAVVAPDKFKGSLSANEAAAAIERGIGAVFGSRLSFVRVPMADGGEGTVDAFVDNGAMRVVRRVRDALGRPIDAAFALDSDLAIIESAAASGLAQIPISERDPMRASSYGTGELVRAALDAGARRIVIALGGSATNDGGAGFLRALGVRILDDRDRELEDGGAALERVARIDVSEFDPRLRSVRFEVAADVDAPLCGPRGASAVFGPQKGASPSDVTRLDRALATFANATARAIGREVRDVAGSGAAGGFGFALVAYFGASIRPGVDIVADLRELSRALEGADYCFTGEGSLDAQTLAGKTVDGVARRARAAGVSATLAFAGRVEEMAEAALVARGVIAVPIVDGPILLEAAICRAAALLERAAARASLLLVNSRSTP